MPRTTGAGTPSAAPAPPAVRENRLSTAAATAEAVSVMALMAPPVTAIRQVLGLGETTV